MATYTKGFESWFAKFLASSGCADWFNDKPLAKTALWLAWRAGREELLESRDYPELQPVRAA